MTNRKQGKQEKGHEGEKVREEETDKDDGRKARVEA